ncbi:MAG: enoyl-CoA hydratase/isomerase family protein [Nostocoides sp.]
MMRVAFGDARFEHLRLDSDDEVLWVLLNRPERLNAMTDLMLREFQAVYAGVERGPWRCVIIAGEGRAFCSGADLGQIGNVIDFTDAEQVRAYLDQGWQRVIEAIRTVSIPTVAAVHGAAYGGGANLALAADLVVAGESAMFCQSYIDRGISPDLGGTVILPRLVGGQQARRLLLLGDPVGAGEALAMGMISSVVADADLRASARAVAARLAAKDQRALNVIRRLVEDAFSRTLVSGLAEESAGVGDTLSSPLFSASTEAYRSTEGASSGAPTTKPAAMSGRDD